MRKHHLSESGVKDYNINRKSILYFFPDLGIHLDNGLFINRINPGSYAAKEGILTVGDRIVSVSKRNIQFFSVILLDETFSYYTKNKYSVKTGSFEQTMKHWSSTLVILS